MCGDTERGTCRHDVWNSEGIYVELRLTLEKCSIEPIFSSNGGTIYVTHKHKIVAVDSVGCLVEERQRTNDAVGIEDSWCYVSL